MPLKFKLSLVFLVMTLSGCDVARPGASIATKMSNEINDTQKYAQRLTQHISDKSECQTYKDQMLKHGRDAVSMNGGFTYLMIETKNAANKAGCSK
jgi:outer membrane lipoprotein-sorting protein